MGPWTNEKQHDIITKSSTTNLPFVFKIRRSNLEFNVLFISMLKCLTFADLILNVNPFANNGWKVLLFLKDGKQNRCYFLNQTTRSALSLVIFNFLAQASPVGCLVFERSFNK